MRWPFGFKKRTTAIEAQKEPREEESMISRAAGQVRKIGRKIARIETESLSMSGPFSESEDGRYLLVREDRDRERKIGGSRDSGNGRFAVTYDERVVFVRDCERPRGGVIANTGTSAITDTLFADRVGSKLYVYSADGELQLSRSFEVNTYSIGISSEGDYVAAQLHSGELYLFDIVQRKAISAFSPKTGWAHSYRFSAKEQIVHLCYIKNNRQYRYSFDGTLLDADRYDRERIEDASSTELVSIVRESVDAAAKEDLPALLSMIDTALEGDLSEYSDYQARALRLRGEILESLEETEQAMSAYREALRIDPKIGVRRKLATLEKRSMSRSDNAPTSSKEPYSEVMSVTATAVSEVLYNFSQCASIGTDIQDQPLSVEHFPRVLTLLESGKLTQNDYSAQPHPVQRVLCELLTQYIMFLTMNPHLRFPSGFLGQSSASSLGYQVTAYMAEHEWPFPQMLQ